MRIALLVGTSLLLSLAAGASGQTAAPSGLRLADSSAESILDHIHGNVSLLVPILRHVGGAQPEEKLDALGDTLEGLALAAPIQVDHNGLRAQQLAGVQATMVFGQAGDSDSSASSNGTPFIAALDWLISIHQEATNLMVRATALDEMLLVVRRPEAILYLVGVATSSDPTAEEAMHLLTQDTDPQSGISHASAAERAQTGALLHDLWSRATSKAPTGSSANGGMRSVPDDEAFGTLSLYARAHGWSQGLIGRSRD